MKPHICFVALNCYNLLSKRDDLAHIGGAEVQQVLMARWLVENGYEISFVTHDYGQADAEKLDGIVVYKAFDRDAGVPGLRFVYPRMTGLWSAMKRANADVYYQRGAGVETGHVATWCRLHHRLALFAAANVADCEKDLPLLKQHRERIMYRWGLRLCSGIIAQTITQQKILTEQLRYSSIVVRNCGEAPVREVAINRTEKNVLWVGRISPEKRFEWLIELAMAVPEYKFDVVGAQNTQSVYGNNLLAQANGMPNIQLHGRVPHGEMDKFYANSRLLCSTSLVEGFPNIFLEAWRVGLPVLTTFDPDGVVQTQGCGWVGGSVADLTDILRKSDQESITRASHSARAYYEENHVAEKTMPVFEEALKLALAGRR